jgi:hypothetical protein
MVNVAWPAALKPSKFGYFPLESEVSGGAAIGGGEQFVISPRPRWGATMTVQLWNNTLVLAARALRSQLKGRANPVVLPNFDGQRVSWPIEAGTSRVLTPAVAHQLAGTYMLEGTAYGGAEIPAAAQIHATIQTSAAEGASQVAINLTQGGPILAGQQFGLSSQRLYEISEIVSVVGAVTTVKIWPPLRAAAAATQVVQFHRAWCLMRCENMSEQLQGLDMLRFAELNLTFVEYL